MATAESGNGSQETSCSQRRTTGCLPTGRREVPQLILEFSREEQRREFWYAIAGMLSGVILAILVFGGFVYLVIRDHATAAGSLLGVGVLNMIQGFVRSRLRK